MGFFNFNRLLRDEGKIINEVQKGLDKDKSRREPRSFTPNKDLGTRRNSEYRDDDYTIKLRKEKIKQGKMTSAGKEDTFIDANGNKTTIDQLNGQTEQLLKEARLSLEEEKINNEAAASEQEIDPKDWIKARPEEKPDYSIDRQFADNLKKNNSPAKRRLDVRKTRSALEKINNTVNKNEALDQALEEDFENSKKLEREKEADLEKSF